MKHFVLSVTVFMFLSVVHGQGLRSLLHKGDSLLKAGRSGGLSETDVVGGLKEALNAGVTTGTGKLSATDGFFADAAVKILMPPEAQRVESTLRGLGMGKMVDDAVLSMNRAAESAAREAAPIFMDAIRSMSISDAFGILRGGDSAATVYLRVRTTNPLTAAFRPVINTNLEKVNATKYWNAAISAYNKVPLVRKVNPDLGAYVTERALSAIFYEIAQQELAIRKDPVARTTALLKKVFGAGR